MTNRPTDPEELRAYRNGKIYRSLARIQRVYGNWLIDNLRRRGFKDFSPAFPAMLSNLDTEGTRIGVLAARAGVSRQAASKLVAQVEASGYATMSPDPSDSRATVVTFTPRGRRMLATVLELVEQFEADLAGVVPDGDVERVRALLEAIADNVDPEGGRLGQGDRRRR